MSFQTGQPNRAPSTAAAGPLRRQKLSFVVPCYNEEENVGSIVAAILQQGLQARYDLELILVDDGSSDGTWAAIQSASSMHPSLRGLRLSRNFGQQAALLAGLTSAPGAAGVSMDADLQHPPALLPDMVGCWRDGAKIVTTTRIDTTRTPWPKRLTARLYYRLFKLLTGLPLAAGQADYRLLDQKVVQAILSCREGNLFLRGLISWVGFPRQNLAYEVQPRHAGSTKYSWKKMLMLALDGAFSFSNTPLRLGLGLGLCVTALAFAYGLYAVAVRLFFKESFGELVPGWASLAGLISLMFGLLFMQLGLMGEYLARVYMEAKGRPQFIVADAVEGKVRE